MVKVQDKFKVIVFTLNRFKHSSGGGLWGLGSRGSMLL